jgi:L-lactate dehydrogenase complex protein LldG
VLVERTSTEHPGSFESWRPVPPAGDAIDCFAAMFLAAGGEVVRVADAQEARSWLADFSSSFAAQALGVGVPSTLAADLAMADPADAPLGISMARGAIAESGSLILDARDGRRAQLLTPTHVVVVKAEAVHRTIRDALGSMRSDLPSAIGLHSGPSKSADIGQVMVKGVHGPGRVVALIVLSEDT